VINFHEWLRIVKNYGVEQTVSGFDKLFLRRKDDGSCAFFCETQYESLCAIQHMKPKACQLWPFKILQEPKYGHPREASYDVNGTELFIYADSMCHGLRYGSPTLTFMNDTVKEFIGVAVGSCNHQIKSTGDVRFRNRLLRF
jgi:hypothetical protein